LGAARVKFSAADCVSFASLSTFECRIARFLGRLFCQDLLKMKLALVMLALVAIVHADMYLHNPRYQRSLQ